MSSPTPFAVLSRSIAGRMFRQRHAVALSAVALMGVALAFWLPSFPESVHRFFQRIFQLQDWSEIVVANDATGLMFFVYWVGVFDVLAIYVVPLEERHLDLYLSKPLTRRQYMLAHLIPVMSTLIAVGALSALVHWVALVIAGLEYPLLPFMGVSILVIAWTVCLVGIVNLAVLSVRDVYSGALIAFLPISITILPGSLYMYRPDVFDGVPVLRDILVFPMTLLWHPDFTERWAFPLAALLFGITVALAVASGRRLEKRDIVG